jgi:hypothetical protein
LPPLSSALLLLLLLLLLALIGCCWVWPVADCNVPEWLWYVRLDLPVVTSTTRKQHATAVHSCESTSHCDGDPKVQCYLVWHLAGAFADMIALHSAFWTTDNAVCRFYLTMHAAQ